MKPSNKPATNIPTTSGRPIFLNSMPSTFASAIIMANGNSKMYHSEDMTRLVNEAGLEVEHIYDGLGQCHSIMVCKIK